MNSGSPYGNLVNLLKESAATIDAGGDALEEGLKSLRAVLRFLSSDPDILGTNTTRALDEIHGALTDLQQGAKPPLLFERDRKQGRPDGLMQDEVRGMLAGALEILIVHGQLKRFDAAKWLADALRRASVSDVMGRPIDRDRLIRWREEASRGSGPANIVVQYDAMKRLARERRAATADEPLVFAKSRAEKIVQLIALKHPHQAPARQTKSRAG